MTTAAHATAPEDTSLLPSMDREQTIAFLNMQGVFSLGLTFTTFEKFQLHRPFLYVFQDSLPIGVFGIENPTRRPSIARIDNPTELQFGGWLWTDGPVDYYAIDPSTKKIILVKSGGNRGRYKVGLVGMPYLFPACDSLFPKVPAASGTP